MNAFGYVVLDKNPNVTDLRTNAKQHSLQSLSQETTKKCVIYLLICNCICSSDGFTFQVEGFLVRGR